MPDAIKDAIFFLQSLKRSPREARNPCVPRRHRPPVLGHGSGSLFSLNKPGASQVCSRAVLAHSSSVT